jgi:hypothetical protein
MALIGGLCTLVFIQFILFPLLFTMLVDYPTRARQNQPQHSIHNSLHEFRQLPQSTRSVQRLKPDPSRASDGTFNGVSMYLVENSTLTSKVHCVGENYRDNAWKHRSCRFHHLCLDTKTHTYTLYQSPSEHKFVVQPFMHVSTLMSDKNNINSVSLGGINQKWGPLQEQLKWWPTVRPSIVTSYYELPDSVVLIPFHSMNGANPGHLVWDDFLPMYTLLDMFQLHDHELLLLRWQESGRRLWASCDTREDKRVACFHMINKFLPLMTGPDYKYEWTTTNETHFLPHVPGRAELVCAKTAVAGMAMLTDHGISKSHGWEEADYEITHNYGRGGLLYEFRNFMVQNMGLPVRPVTNKSPHRIVFSQKSSDIRTRSLDFERQIELTKAAFPYESVENYILKDLSLKQQMEVASDASVFVSLCGGGAITAMFLPKGASVIVYYVEDGGVIENTLTGLPARLDWDIFNHMSHLHVHWMPRNLRRNSLDEEALIALIRHELDAMDGEYFS